MNWEKWQNIDRRIIYLLVTLVLIIPIFKPMGLPITVQKDLTGLFYDRFNKIPAGSIVYFDAAYSPAQDAEITPMVKALFKQLMKNGVKLVVGGQFETGVPFINIGLTQVAKEVGAKYGEDYVEIGYKPGGVATVRVMINDFWKACASTDFYGKSFDALPLMQRVKKFDESAFAAIVIFESGAPGMETWYTYTPKIPLYKASVMVEVSGSLPYLKSGQLRGVLPGMRGAAEYEKLLKAPGAATKLMDAQSAAHLLVILLLVVGNVGYLMSTRRGRA